MYKLKKNGLHGIDLCKNIPAFKGLMVPPCSSIYCIHEAVDVRHRKVLILHWARIEKKKYNIPRPIPASFNSRTLIFPCDKQEDMPDTDNVRYCLKVTWLHTDGPPVTFTVHYAFSQCAWSQHIKPAVWRRPPIIVNVPWPGPLTCTRNPRT